DAEKARGHGECPAALPSLRRTRAARRRRMVRPRRSGGGAAECPAALPSLRRTRAARRRRMVRPRRSGGGDPAQRASARKRLADADPLVRLRAAQGLLGRGRKEGVPALIDLLRGTPLEVAWQAEELLHWAAADKAPEAVLSAGSEAARNRCRDAWRAWW